MDWEFAIDDDDPISRNADKIAPILLEIEKREGCVAAESVVSVAKKLPTTHPLHQLIWKENDTTAAMRWRLKRAADVIRAIDVILRVDKKSPVKTRLFFIGTARGEYHNVVNIMGAEETRSALLGQAAEDAETYKQRYSILKETGVIVDAINEFLKTGKSKKTGKLKATSNA